jgi:hypothetical protein
LTIVMQMLSGDPLAVRGRFGSTWPLLIAWLASLLTTPRVQRSPLATSK